MTDYSDSERWTLASVIHQTQRGVYLVSVDIGDEIEPHTLYWAKSTLQGAKNWARHKGEVPLHWSEQRLNPGELVYGYALRKYYLATITDEERQAAEDELDAAGGRLEVAVS